MKTVITTHDLHQLATMCHNRAEEYRAPYVENDEENRFVTSTSYPIYAMLQEMWLMFNKFADNLDERVKNENNDTPDDSNDDGVRTSG